MSSPAEAAVGSRRSRFRSFLEEAGHQHAAAVAKVGAVEQDLGFGDRRVRLCFAGQGLAKRLLRALAPRTVPGNGLPDATIRLWEADPLVALTLPWREEDAGPRGLVLDSPGGQPVAVDQSGSGLLTLIEPDTRALLYRVNDASQLPWWELAAPLRPALHWALSGEERHLVHAGAVGDEVRGGALLAGRGGSGKTTVALAAIEGGLRYVADDYLLLHATSQPTAWNLYGCAKLDEDQRVRFPDLGATASYFAPREPDDKMVLDIAAERPRALVESLPVRAVIVPRVRGERTAVRRISGAEALLALAPSTVFQMPYDGGAVVGSLAAIAGSVPCYSLDVGGRPAELAAAVDRVLDQPDRELG